MIGSTVSHYRIEEELGRGGMGVVYRAVDERLGRPVALKFLPADRTGDPEGRRRFLEEARAASALNHPNILTIHDFGETNGRTYIVMEYLDGETLTERIEAGPLGFDEIMGIVRPVADALKSAHENGIIHRDVKPGNIMLTTAGRVKLMDFGLAKLTGGDELTGDGELLGTSSWMSPEQIRGEDLDARTDIWSFGVVLYEMCTREHPFHASRLEAVVYRVLNESPADPRTLDDSIPDSLAKITLGCIEKNRDDRYADALELLADLDTAADEAGLDSARAGAWSDVVHHVPSLIAAAAAGLLITITIVFALPSVRSAIGIGTRTSIAVLPVTASESGTVKMSSLDDMHREITGMLDKLAPSGQGFSVVPVEKVRSEDIWNARQARAAFGVDRVLGLSVSGSEGELDLSLAMIDAADQDTLSRDTIRISVPGILSSAGQTSAAVTAMVEADSSMNRSATLDLYLDARVILNEADTAADIDTAIAAFERAITRDDRHALSHAGLGEAYWLKYMRTGNTEHMGRAAEEAHVALGLADSLARVHVTLGLTYLEQGRDQEAVDAFRRALRIEDTHYDAIKGLGRALWQAEDLAGAVARFEHLTRLRPDDPDGYTLLGRLYYDEGDIQKAADAFRRAVDRAPENALAHSNLAAAYDLLGRHDDSQWHLDRSIELNPRPIPLRNRAAESYFRGNYEQAIEDLEHALDLSDMEYRTWSLLANALYWTEGRSEKAKEAWIETSRLTGDALRMDSTDLDALNYRVAALANLNRHTEAHRAIRRLKRDPRLRGTHYNTLAHAYERMGQRDSALVYVEKALYEGIQFKYVLNSPWLQDLRKDERFIDIQEKMGISHPPS